MVSLAIPKEDLETMSYTDLNTQKKFLTNKEEQNPDIKLVNEQNFKNISQELNARYTKYVLIAGVGLIVGMIAIRKLK
jgi:NADH:ubiquinone oxidoreductase subunit 6 (subunit J)